MILLIDNYDSFVFNVKTMLESLYDGEVRLLRNDCVTVDEIKKLKPEFIVLSPGPKHPKDSGVCLDIFESRLKIPILGICLGHQALGLCFKCKIARLKEVAHGISSKIYIQNEGLLFKDMPKSFEVMRYHSLCIENLSDDFELLAKTSDDIVMAIKHKNLPYFGVQFHPESFFSEYGLKIFENFLSLKKQQKKEEAKNLAFYLNKIQDSHKLSEADFADICKLIISKEYEPIQLGALLVLITEKSLDENSLSSLVKSVLKYSQTFSDESDMIDIVGTGGDGFKSINVSTTVAFILASLGLKVAKHGNKAISSSSGSSDVLDELGICSFNSISKHKKLLDENGLSFFHAPYFHSLVGEIKDVRTRLGVKNVFNVLGPLLNPNLKLKYQMMGNYHAPVHKLLIKVLKKLGRKKALLVRGNDGMDELSICDDSKIYELDDGKIFSYSISPEQFGFKRAMYHEIIGSNAKENAKILLDTISGKIQGAKLDIVVLNAMFALYTAKIVDNPLKAKDMILEAIYSGRVLEFFENYREKTRLLNED